MIFSFYSYKGGVGRSQLLVNLASYLCHYNNKKILLLDWDLEAPGLHFYFKKTNEDITQNGLMDILIEYVNLMDTNNPIKKENLNYFKEENIIPNLIQSKNKKGHVDLIPVVKYSEEFTHKINDFNWQEFMEYKDGNVYISFLKEKLKLLGYDYIFIDSRTGVTDYSGLCNILFPDANVIVVAPTEQNFSGSLQITNAILNHPYLLDNRRKSLVLPILSRVDMEASSVDTWINRFEEDFAFTISHSLDNNFKDLIKQVFRDIYRPTTTIVYNRNIALGENIVFDSDAKPIIERTTADSYQNIGAFINDLKDKGALELYSKLNKEHLNIWLEELTETNKYSIIGNLYEELGNLKSASDVYIIGEIECSKLLKKDKNNEEAKSNLLVYLEKIGDCKYDLGELESALTYRLKKLKILKKDYDPNFFDIELEYKLNESNLHLADIYLKLSNYKEAINFLEEIHRINGLFIESELYVDEIKLSELYLKIANACKNSDDNYTSSIYLKRFLEIYNENLDNKNIVDQYNLIKDSFNLLRFSSEILNNNKLERNIFIDIGNCEITRFLPIELLEHSWLEKINFGLTYYDKKFNIRKKTNNSGPKNIFTGKELKNLKKLQNLTDLSLCSCEISDISFLQNLSQLTSIDLSDNQIQDYSFLEDLTQLRFLSLRSNQIQDISFLQNLTQLTYLDLSDNQIHDISSLQNLNQLVYLDLSNNQIQDISHLEKLTQFNFLEQGQIMLNDNPIIIPPSNILRKGKQAIVRFFENTLETKYEGKLLIVGEPESGKTTLRNRLLIPGYEVPNDTKSTIGIQVDKWVLPNPQNEAKTMQVNVWDFGGQDIQYMTHQFFLTSDALYILLTSARKDLDNLDYWFNIIRVLGKNENNQHSKLMVVANEINMEPVTHFVKEDFKKRYTELDFEYFNVNFATNKNKDGRFNTLVYNIKENLARLPSMGRKLPVKWGIVRKRLAGMPENSISINRYQQICADAELDKESAYDLSGYLHTIGEAIHFQNDYKVDDFIILKPKWAVDAVYVILKNEDIKNGHFTQKQVYQLWKKNGYPEEEWARLLSLMTKHNFEISYPLPESTTDFIAPQLLADTPPNYKWESDNTLKFRYSYAFMPKGIITRFIVRQHEDIAYQDGEGLVWKNGVILRDEYTGFMAQVRETKIQEMGFERKVIDIEIIGEKGHRKSLLVKVCKNIEKIHNEFFAGLSFERLVPCNCVDCAGTENPTFYDYSELVELYNEGLDARCRKNRIKEVTINDIFKEIVDLDDSFTKVQPRFEDESEFGRLDYIKQFDSYKLQDPFQATQKDKKVFFSYAWADNKEPGTSREEIVNQLYESLKSDNFEVVRDKVDLGYKGSISDFMRTIGRGDCVIVAISDKYLRSPNCMFELYEAFRNSKLEKKAFVEKIIPVRVEEINLSPTARGKYRNHWNEKKTEWDEYVSTHAKDISASEKEEHERIKSIVNNLGTIFEILNDINSSTMALLSKDDFAEIKKEIKRMQGLG